MDFFLKTGLYYYSGDTVYLYNNTAVKLCLSKHILSVVRGRNQDGEPGVGDVTAPATSQHDRFQVHWPEQMFQKEKEQHWAVLMSAGK